MKDLMALRIDRALTQLELASRAGITNITVHNLENGKSIPQKQVRKTLEAILCSRIDWLATTGIPINIKPTNWEEAEQGLRKALQNSFGLSIDDRRAFVTMASAYLKTLSNLMNIEEESTYYKPNLKFKRRTL